MFKFVTTLSLISLLTLFSISCGDEITNQYSQGDGNPPNVNVIYSSYTLKTVHSFHMDTTAYPDYNYCIDLFLQLDKPQNRSQINKMIIVNQDGIGWEFFKEELEDFYSSAMEGYELTNLIYRSSSQYSTLYTVKLFSSTNGTAEDYQFILLPNFIYTSNMSHHWYTQEIYQLDLGYYFTPSASTEGEIYFLDQNKGLLSSENFTASDIFEYRYLRFGNVPQEAYYFYISYHQEIESGVFVSFLSELFAIEARYPENVQILNEYLYDFDVVKYVPEIQKILILDRSYYLMFIVDYNSFTLDSKVDFNNSPYSVAYSTYDGKIYVGCNNGQLYSLSVSNPSPTFVKNLGTSYIYGMVVVNKFLVASTYNDTYRILNLEDNSVTVENSQYYYESTDLVYNSTYKVVYGLSYYGNELSRFNFDPATGTLSNYYYKYVNNSEGNELLLYPDDSRIVAPNGYIYSCSSNVLNDLTVYDNLEQEYISAAFSQDGNGIITFYGGYYTSYSSINIYEKNSLNELGSVEDFFDLPEYLVSDGQTIKVLSHYNNVIIAELFNYSDIISGSSKMRSKLIKEKFYQPKKLIY